MKKRLLKAELRRGSGSGEADLTSESSSSSSLSSRPSTAASRAPAQAATAAGEVPKPPPAPVQSKVSPVAVAPSSSSSSSHAAPSSSSSIAALLKMLGPPPKGYLYHVFLNHDWGKDEFGRDNHRTLILIYNALLKHGVLCWFDEARMEGQIVKKMTEGIDQSFLVLAFITKNYLEKVNGDNANDNCQIEFGYFLVSLFVFFIFVKRVNFTDTLFSILCLV